MISWLKDYGTDWQQAELELKAAKADLLGTGSASVWDVRYIGTVHILDEPGLGRLV